MFYIPWLWPFRKYSEERAMSHGLYGLCVHVVGGTHVSCAGIPFPIPIPVLASFLGSGLCLSATSKIKITCAALHMTYDLLPAAAASQNTPHDPPTAHHHASHVHTCCYMHAQAPPTSTSHPPFLPTSFLGSSFLLS